MKDSDNARDDQDDGGILLCRFVFARYQSDNAQDHGNPAAETPEKDENHDRRVVIHGVETGERRSSVHRPIIVILISPSLSARSIIVIIVMSIVLFVLITISWHTKSPAMKVRGGRNGERITARPACGEKKS